MNLLRKEVILYSQALKYLLQLEDELRSSVELLYVLLKVYGVRKEEHYLHLVHVFDICHNHMMLWLPILGLAFYVPVRQTFIIFFFVSCCSKNSFLWDISTIILRENPEGDNF